MKIKKGFSLVEILIVLMIAGIIASFGFPLYKKEIIKVRRSEIAVTLLHTAAVMEHYYLQHHTYIGAVIPQENSSSFHYHLSLETPDSNSYVLKAAPIGSQLKEDVRCGTLTINQSGIRSISGTGAVNQCW